MATRSAAVLGACMIACCLVLGHYVAPPLAAEDVPGKGAAGAAAAGRYHLKTAGKDGQYLILLDTATGRWWWRNVLREASAQWEDRAPPVAAKAAP
jgi:hypothetical protein